MNLPFKKTKAEAASSTLISETETEMVDVTSDGRTREPLPDQKDRIHDYQDLLLLSGLRIKLKYRILDRLGSGRQGIVIRVERRSHPDCITSHALKIFDPSIYHNVAEYDEDIRRIARQVGDLQRLYHPNLVQCNWMYGMRGIGMMMMELVEGMNLGAVMDREEDARLAAALPPTEWVRINRILFDDPNYGMEPGPVFYILRKMLRGLEVLHQSGYIHCDIKPDNIMIDRFGTVKLIDFGRAVSIENPRGILLGSPMYMAPEVHRRRTLTLHSDLYSVGIVALELLHGGHLLDPYSNEETIYRFKLELPKCIGDFLPTRLRASNLLISILKRLVAVKAKNRYASANEADTGSDGVRVLLRELARARLDADYGRELERYLAHRLTLDEQTKKKEEETVD